MDFFRCSKSPKGSYVNPRRWGLQYPMSMKLTCEYVFIHGGEDCWFGQWITCSARCHRSNSRIRADCGGWCELKAFPTFSLVLSVLLVGAAVRCIVCLYNDHTYKGYGNHLDCRSHNLFFFLLQILDLTDLYPPSRRYIHIISLTHDMYTLYTYTPQKLPVNVKENCNPCHLEE